MPYEMQKGFSHNRCRRIIPLVLLVMLLTPLKPVFALEYVPADKRIGVLSVMGDYARLTGLGMGAYDWRTGGKRDVLKRVNVNNWRIDAYVREKIAIYLKNNTPFRSFDVTVDSKTIRNIFDWRGDLRPDGGKALSKLMDVSDFNFLLLIAPTTYNEVNFIYLGKGQIMLIKGPTFYGYGSFYNKGGRMSVYVLAAAYLIDVSTGKIKSRSYIGCQQRIKLEARSLRDDEKRKILEYVTEDIHDQGVIAFFRERILQPTISEQTKKEIIEKYEGWTMTEDADDYVTKLENMLNPPHHTIHTFKSISKMEQQRVGNEIKTCMNESLKEAIAKLIIRIK